jgi:thiol-disulfide isomerase/thioredoxin
MDGSPVTGKTIDGGRFPSAGQAGDVVIVNFWATWCAPCRAEMPALDDYYQHHRGEGLAVLAVSVDAGASIRKLVAATAAYRFQVARLDDVKMARSAIPTAIPTTRIYDRSGALRYDSSSKREQAPLDEEILDRVVTPLLVQGATTH